MKKVCFLIGDINNSGGTERVTSIIANSLSRNNFQISILSIANGQYPFFDLEPNVKIYSLFERKISMKSNFLAAVHRIRCFLCEHKIDTLIVVDSISCIFTVPACIGLSINHICWEHFNLKVNIGSRFRDIGRWMAAKWCTKIITLTERDKCFWDEYFSLKDSNKVVAIVNPSPYDLQRNTPSLEYRNILCVGRLTHQKGFDLLIKAWSKIAVKLPEWTITIVGTGEDETKLKRMIVDLNVENSINFVGQQKDMDQFYRNASFFCMSSRFEGLPMVLLEAQSYGLPIVSFDCDTGPSELIDDGINGFLVNMNDDLSIKILEMCRTTSLTSFSEKAFERSRFFSVKCVIEKWRDLI